MIEKWITEYKTMQRVIVTCDEKYRHEMYKWVKENKYNITFLGPVKKDRKETNEYRIIAEKEQLK